MTVIGFQRPLTRRSGALFTFGECGEADFAHYMELLRAQPKQRELIECVYDLCSDDHEGFTDMVSVCARLGLGRPGVLLRMRPLLEQGILKNTLQKVYAGTRSTNVYELQKSSALPLARAQLAQSDARLSHQSNMIEQPRLNFASPQVEQALQLFYDPSNRTVWKGERFLVFSLLGGLRLARQGEERTRKETRIHMGPRWFDVTIRALESSMIPSVIDLRVLIVVCTLIRDYLQNAAVPPNPNRGFELDMDQICTALELESCASNKRHLFEQLLRWRHSGFTVTQAMNGALDWAKGLELQQEFSVISRLNAVKYLGKEGGAPELIQVFLDPCVLAALSDLDRNFIVHPQILRDRKPSGFMHLYYYWCRRVVQLSDEGKFFLLTHVHRELQPDKDLRHFRSDTLNMLEEWEIKDDFPAHYPRELSLSKEQQLLQYARQQPIGRRRNKNRLIISRIPGYLLRYSNDELGVWVDPDCELIGEANRKRIAARNKVVTHSSEKT